MTKKLYVVLAIVACITHVCATPPKHEKSIEYDDYLDEKIKEFDAKLSEYLHVPIKKFGTILNDIADHIYSEEFTPLHQELKHLREEVAQLKGDLKRTNKDIQMLTKEVESLRQTNSKSKPSRKWN